MLALADAERQQAADDGVDAGLDLPVTVGAILEQEEDVVGAIGRLLVEQRG